MSYFKIGSYLFFKLAFSNKVVKIESVLVRASPIMETLTGFMIAGLIYYSGNLIIKDQLDINKPYLFIGNHRDITLDSALCNHSIDSIGLDTTHNAIGDNLVSIKWMGDLLRLYKSFVISRKGESKKSGYLIVYMPLQKYDIQLRSIYNEVNTERGPSQKNQQMRVMKIHLNTLLEKHMENV